MPEPYIYTNKKGFNYILYWSRVYVRGGKEVKIYYLLREDKQPSNTLYRAYIAASLPKTMEIREVGVNCTPLVYKVRNGEDKWKNH